MGTSETRQIPDPQWWVKALAVRQQLPSLDLQRPTTSPHASPGSTRTVHVQQMDLLFCTTDPTQHGVSLTEQLQKTYSSSAHVTHLES